MLKEIALKTKVRKNLCQSKTRSLETRIKCLFFSNAVEETSIKWFRILSLSVVAVTLPFVCSFFCRSALEKLSYHLWITWMMARALNSRFPLTRRRYGVLNRMITTRDVSLYKCYSSPTRSPLNSSLPPPHPRPRNFDWERADDWSLNEFCEMSCSLHCIWRVHL